MKLCSACLLGIKCRYNGKSKPSEKVLDLASEEALIPVCPEQLGGLSTPRMSSEVQKDGSVRMRDGKDATKNYDLGARQVLELAKIFKCKTAILKQDSPSCGCGQVYDGTFSGTLTEGDGITTRLLKSEGIAILTEDDL